MFFDKFDEPVVYRVSDSLKNEISRLNSIKTSKNKEEIEKNIKLLEYGVKGEEKILYELKNSHIGMYILNDIKLKHNDLTAQIDYLVITRKNIYIIECKNLYGNITIDNKGNFIRTININGKIYKEGIYSPITQNQRHLDLIHQLKKDGLNFIQKSIVDKLFDKYYHSIVVLANDKTILNDKYAPKYIKDKVIRADQLIEYIKKMEKGKENIYSLSDVKQIAENYAKYSNENEIQTIECANQKPHAESVNNKVASDTKSGNKIIDCEDVIYKCLKNYRHKQSVLESVKPYFIFNDQTLRELVSKKPKNKDELLSVYGFGTNKVNKYGDDIIKIIKENML